MLLNSLKAGKITSAYGEDFEFSSQDIADIANSYNPADFCARMYREHKDEDQGKPHVGTVKLALSQGGNLWVMPEQLAPDFEADLQSRKRHSISVRLFRPGEKGKTWMLRHVAFPDKPACEGMKPPEFSGEVKPALFELPVEFAQPPDNPEPPMPEENNPSPVDLAAQNSALEAENKRLKQQAVDFAKQQATAHKQKAVDFAAGLCQSGQLKPALKDRLSQVLSKLPLGPVEFSVGENSTKTATLLDELSEVIAQALPKDPRFEQSKVSGTPVPGQTPPVDFAAPAGVAVDQNSLNTHAKALDYCKQRDLNPDEGSNYINAVAAVSPS